LTALNYWSPAATKKVFSWTSDAEFSLRQLLNTFSVQVRHWVSGAKQFGQCGGLISKGHSTGRLTLDKEAVYAVENLVNKHAVTEHNIAEE
jgi:hypothetical protein